MMSKVTTRFYAGLMAVLLGLGLGISAGCTADQQPENLYQRLGGKDAIAAVVAEFVGNVAADPRINARFAHTDIPRLKVLLTEQICQGSGGPCPYTGRDMKTTHRGMAISEAEFNALVENLVKALNTFKVAQREQDELLGILGPMKTDIVNQ